jgi:single-stranded-DNA-specific exonuclease
MNDDLNRIRLMVFSLVCNFDDRGGNVPVKSLTGRQWIFGSVSDKDVAFLKQNFGLSDAMARLTAHRLGSLEGVQDFLMPSIRNTLVNPLYLPDVIKAFQCVEQVLYHKKPLGIWGDYDVDGACASALLMRYFRLLGVGVDCHIPNRFDEGYGPNAKGLLAMQAKGIHDVIIVDCGTSAIEPLAQAKKANMNVLVIDHHEPGPIVADVVALVNPKRWDFSGPEDLKTLSAGGLVFVFLVGLNRYLRTQGFFDQHGVQEPDLMSFLDLVALSTVCDLMPLGPMNRSFVKRGEKVLAQQKNKGLSALARSAKVRGVVSAYHLAFRIGPRINAAGRLGESSLGACLLSSDDPVDILSIVSQMETLNKKRQEIEQEVMAQAQNIFDQSGIQKSYCLVYGHGWHEGVLGIVAGRLKEIYHVPCFVLSGKGGMYKGSARSVPGFDLSALVHSAKDKGILLEGGGHAMAAGVSVLQDRIDDFRCFLDDFFERSKGVVSAPSVLVEGALTIEQAQSLAFMDDLDRLAPFGPGCPMPYFMMSCVTLDRPVLFGGQHLRVRLTQSNGRSCFVSAFRIANQSLGQWIMDAPRQGVDCVVSVRTETFLGIKKASLFLEDVSDHSQGEKR